MRVWAVTLIACLALTFVGCSREDKAKTERELGKAAYKAKEVTKKAAQKAAKELHQAGQQAHEGWKEAKREREAKEQKK